MRVFLEISHTSCDSEIMKSGFDFDVLCPSWDAKCRPKPQNARVVSGPDGEYDCAIVCSRVGFDLFKARETPIIWKSFVDFGKWPRPPRVVYDRISAWTTLCRESASRFSMGGDPNACVIEPGIDTNLFSGYIGSSNSVITTGHLIPNRTEKGPDVLRRVARDVKISCIGTGNDALTESGIQVIPHAPSPEALVDTLKFQRAYFNPCGVVCCAALEAMSIGMPVVTMRPGNLSDFMVSRKNCFIADTEAEAVGRLEFLLENRDVAQKVGYNARASIVKRMSSRRCASRWKRLVESVSRR